VLLIEVPCDQVDVNVHPAKNEVRFARPNDVHELIRRAVAQTLYDVDQPSWKPVGFQEIKLEASQVRDEKESFGDHPPMGGAFSSDYRSEVASENRGWKAAPTIKQEPHHISVSFVGEAPGLRSQSHFGGVGSSLDDRGGTPLPQNSGESSIQYPVSSIQYPASSPPPQASGFSAQADLWEKRGFSGMRVIGQLRDTYIICEAEDGLVLIDQHAAHERVLYEQLARRAESLRQASQALLVPETVDLGHREAQALEALMPHLRELGLEIEPFGGGTVVVKAVPGFLAGREVRLLLEEIAESAMGSEAPSKPQEALDFCRQRAACHGAIRAGQTLTSEQMQTLLRQLDECGNLSHCPHGRPTWIKWETGMIERLFRRKFP